MTAVTGIPPNGPTKYLGPNVAYGTVVSRPREPTSADYRQPETGRLYPLSCHWVIGNDPSTGVVGDVWILTKIAANVAFWEKITGASGGTMQGINVDAFTAPGSNPVIPDDEGLMTITGAQVASGVVGTNVIRTDSLAANSFKIEVQRSTTSASTDVTKNGVCHFKSADFTIDSSGFVSASDTGIGQTITGDTGVALSPSSGNWNIIVQKNGDVTDVNTIVSR